MVFSFYVGNASTHKYVSRINRQITTQYCSKSIENMNTKRISLVKNQNQLGRNEFDPNSWFGSHQIMVFGINTAGIKTFVKRVPLVCRV